MKTLITLILAFVLASCSITPEQKAKTAIKEKLRLTLHDTNGYEAVTFGALAPTCTELISQPGYVENTMSAERCYIKYEKKMVEAGWFETKADIKLFTDLANAALDSGKIYKSRYEKIRADFTPDTIGWQMDHSFRAKNLLGNFRLEQYTFFFDKKLTTVVKIMKNSNSDS